MPSNDQALTDAQKCPFFKGQFHVQFLQEMQWLK